jgi:SAM-dependent methyltransferase
MRTLLPEFLDRVKGDFYDAKPQESGSRLRSGIFKLVDLGCGTGRNTLQLLAAVPEDTEIVGLDASTGMLDVARKALETSTSPTNWKDRVVVRLETYDLLRQPASQLLLGGTAAAAAQDAAGIISTLVLEHIPLDLFFAHAAALLRPGGHLLVTNMHTDMGALSQAGFVDRVTGKKVRPISYAHTVPDVLAAAGQAGFEVVTLDENNTERVRERTVTEEMVHILGPRARKWVGVTVWFGVCFRKKEE